MFVCVRICTHRLQVVLSHLLDYQKQVISSRRGHDPSNAENGGLLYSMPMVLSFDLADVRYLKIQPAPMNLLIPP